MSAKDEYKEYKRAPTAAPGGGRKYTIAEMHEKFRSADIARRAAFFGEPCTAGEALARSEAIQEEAARLRVRPQGATAHQGPAKGWKSDAGKPLAGIVLRQFSAALMGVAKVMTLGTTKEGRTEDNWQSVENGYTRYYDAFARHLLTFGGGTLHDATSKLPHIDHMITNLMIMRHFLVKEGKIE